MAGKLGPTWRGRARALMEDQTKKHCFLAPGAPGAQPREERLGPAPHSSEEGTGPGDAVLWPQLVRAGEERKHICKVETSESRTVH